jgi:hypothetical protein
MRKVSTLVGLAVLILAGSARAQDEAPATAPVGDAAAAPAEPAGDPAAMPGEEAAPAAAPMAAGAYPDEYALRPLTLAGGTFQATVPVVLNLSKDRVLKPVMVPLDLRFGVNDQLEVFLTHPGMAALSSVPVGASPAYGGGVCIGGTDRGCPKFYNNLAIGGQMSLSKSGGIELSGIGAVDIRQFSPDMLLAIDLGVGFKYVSAPISIKATPVIGIGATKRSDGNKEVLSIPVQVAFQATPQLAAFLDTGIVGPLSHFGDFYGVPVGIGASFLASHGLDVGAEFMLPLVVSGLSGNKALDGRTLAIFASYRTN